MPNGGVPMHMALYPANGKIVIKCKGGEVRLYDRREWKEKKTSAQPIAILSEAEAGAFAWFLRYWLGEGALQPGYQMGNLVKAEFDF